MRVFIGWSGSVSKSVAEAHRDWLPCVLQAVKPFVSEDDIANGASWRKELACELKSTDCGIVCVTPFNLSAAWLSFEAGALSKALDSARVVPFLFDVEAKDVIGPLAQFQAALSSEKGALGLVHSLNDKLAPEARLANCIVDMVFEKWWPDLKRALNASRKVQEDSTETGIEWLYRPGDLVRQEMNDQVRTVWVITPSPTWDLDRTCVKDMIRQKIDKGVCYTFIMPKSDQYPGAVARLNQIFSDHPGQLTIEPIDRDTFESLAVTHYLVLNPDRELDLEVLLELPIVQRDYWVKVTDDAASCFASRFRSMIKEAHEHKASTAVSLPACLPKHEITGAEATS